MKKSENNIILFREMNSEELANVSGGSFAYDLGRFIRFVGIYYYEGTGLRGYSMAVADFCANVVVNNQ